MIRIIFNPMIMIACMKIQVKIQMKN